MEPYSGRLYGGIEIFDCNTRNLSTLGGLILSPDVPRGRVPIAVDTSQNRIYVSPNMRSTVGGSPVLVIDGSSDKIVEGLLVSGITSDYQDIAVDEDSSYIYVLLTEGRILIFDGNNEIFVTQIYLPARSSTQRIAINPAINVAYTANSKTGTVSVIEPLSKSLSPVTYFQLSPHILEVRQSVTFDASYSYDPDGGDITSYEWDFGDGNKASGRIVEHAYSEIGNYTMQLTTKDNEGDSSSKSSLVCVKTENHPPAIIGVSAPTQ